MKIDHAKLSAHLGELSAHVSARLGQVYAIMSAAEDVSRESPARYMVLMSDAAKILIDLIEVSRESGLEIEFLQLGLRDVEGRLRRAQQKRGQPS